MDISKNPDEQNRLANDYGMFISRLAHRMISNSELAKEAAQESWYEIVKNLHQFKGESKISTWVYTVAKRTILKYASSERVYTAKEINDHFELEAIDYEGEEQSKKEWVKEKCDYCLTAFCHCLDNDARIIFLFREIVGLSYPEISFVMETNEENIRKILSKSREKVKNFMNDACILYNPKGSCKCRIQKHVKAVDLDREYLKLSSFAKIASLFKKFDQELPRKNYWENLFKKVVTN